ncbi:hypothetical protein [Deinococcus indicus]|nr:hypothetical protein [Deinococcus indicus]GHG14912.1 hypothetical protein GCM10017784_01750 [Deinococcus indicus]
MTGSDATGDDRRAPNARQLLNATLTLLLLMLLGGTLARLL